MYLFKIKSPNRAILHTITVFLKQQSFTALRVTSKFNKITLLRSPHANKNAREQFASNMFTLFANFRGSPKQCKFFHEYLIKNFSSDVYISIIKLKPQSFNSKT